MTTSRLRPGNSLWVWLAAFGPAVAMPILIVVLLIANGVRATSAGAHGGVPLSAASLVLTIAADKDEYKVGEMPRITATLENRSGEDANLAHPLDGSWRGRYPIAQFAVTAPEGAPPPQIPGMCGNTNPIMRDAFFTLKAGATHVLYDGANPVVPYWELERGPGEYRIQLHYSTDMPDADRWLGGPMMDSQKWLTKWKVGSYLKNVSPVDVRSNELAIRFVE